MCYLVTGVNPSISVSGNVRHYQVFDTEVEAKRSAEQLLKSSHNDVAIWKQFATPKIEQTVVWGEVDAGKD